VESSVDRASSPRGGEISIERTHTTFPLSCMEREGDSVGGTVTVN